MQQWERGSEFSADGLSISVLCFHGEESLLAVSAKAGRFYYAEKVRAFSAATLDIESVWFLSFLDRAKRKREQEEAFLWRRAGVSVT